MIALVEEIHGLDNSITILGSALPVKGLDRTFKRLLLQEKLCLND